MRFVKCNSTDIHLFSDLQQQVTTLLTMHGYWNTLGYGNSNVDWCEPNYLRSFYIAEFYNTISNLPLITLATIGIINAFSKRELFGYRFVIVYCFLWLVGIGSFMFHMTLLYPFQLLDELPMIFGSLVFLYILTDLPGSSKAPFDSKFTISKTSIVLVLSLYALVTCTLMAIFSNR